MSHDTGNFEVIRDLIWEKSGLYFESTKRQYFSRRVQNRMRFLSCRGLNDYYRILRYEQPETELTELLNVLTTTETYFFRNNPQLRSFKEEILPALLKEKQANGQYSLKVWSAGCSSGEEPYTLAMILRETIPDIERWNISVVGTDVNTRVLQKAREGLYSVRSLRETSPEYRSKYFLLEGESFRITEEIKNMVTLRVGNLMDLNGASFIKDIDCIFCRNVLIYFNVESCKKVINLFYDNLARHGYLLLGHSESLFRISAIFKLVKLQHSLVYYKE